MAFQIEDKVVLITGAAGDIGVSIVSEFLKEGCRVIATGTKLERLQSKLAHLVNGKFRHDLTLLQMDIVDSASIHNVMEYVNEHFGCLDILINSAGILCRKSFDDTEKSDLEESLQVNTVGAFDLCHQAAEIMKKQRSGTMITIGSQNGLTAMENRLAYSASKAALTMMTKTMALELADYGITVNMVAPGIVDSSMAMVRLNNPEIRAEFERFIPLHRLVSPLDVANSTLFMASPYASCITGTVLLVDGGLLIRQSLPK